jgi:transcriptional regulator with XRE-family HTH domain
LVQHFREMSLAHRDPERGRRIAALREAADLVQKELADKLNVDPQSVSRWERGGKMNPKNLDRLAAFFKVSAEFILSGGREKTVVTHPAFTEYLAWLDQNPDERADLPLGAVENIQAFRLTIGSDYEPTQSDYIALHNIMKGLKKRRRGRA